ncbi:MAG: histidinol dehydrogenase [Planctomycetota bacterium]|jgi:histidinol dehydrogenase
MTSGVLAASHAVRAKRRTNDELATTPHFGRAVVGTPTKFVGPGNRWVTAAKEHLVGEVGIDGLAGPSELLVLADQQADAATVAADLLAQAEHDDDAVPILVTTSVALLDDVERELTLQLQPLPTASTAAASLRGNGAAMVVAGLDEAVQVANRLAPEHLELCVQDPEDLCEHLTAYGSLFVGAKSAEVFGDYGAGPNHVLPTGGGSRFQAGLSVLTFLRPLTYLQLRDPSLLRGDAAALARLEGLEGHARSAERRGMSRL